MSHSGSNAEAATCDLGFTPPHHLTTRWSSLYIHLVWPPPCNSDHQDYYMFSRGFLLTFTFNCYREGDISNSYMNFSSSWYVSSRTTLSTLPGTAEITWLIPLSPKSTIEQPKKPLCWLVTDAMMLLLAKSVFDRIFVGRFSSQQLLY